MIYKDIPTSSQVADALSQLGGSATAYGLCQRLVEQGRPRRDSQLAIQRAAENSVIQFESDLTLSLCREVESVWRTK